MRSGNNHIIPTATMKAVLFFFFVLTLVDGSGQTRLNLSEAIALALEKNTEVIKGRNNHKADKRARLASYGEWVPTLTFNGNARRVTGRNFDQVSGEVRTETGEFANAGFNFNWNILNVVKNISNVRSARYNAMASMWGLKNTEDFTTIEVIRNYVEVLQNQEQIRIIRKFIEAQEKNLIFTEEQWKVGAMAKQDVYIQKAEFKQIEIYLTFGREHLEYF